MKFVYLLVWCWEWFGDLLLICWCCIPCCKLRFGIKMVVSSFSFEHVNCIVFEIWLWYKDVSFRGLYHTPRWILYFEGRIACRDGYYYQGSCRAPRQMHGQYMSPMGPRMRDSGCVSLGKTCITVLDICIPLYWTYLSLINLILCFADLVSVPLWNLWVLNIELLLRICKLINCGYWVVYLVNCKLLGCSVEV